MIDAEARMLVRCSIGGRLSAYRPSLVSASADSVQVRGMMPLRPGLTVEISLPGSAGKMAPQPSAAIVERCDCGADGLFLIELRLIGGVSGIRTPR